MNKLLAAHDRRRQLAREVRQLALNAFHQQLKDAGIYRGFILYENGQFQLSHAALLQPLQAFLELSQDFACHEGVFFGREDDLDAIFWAFVHDTRRGLSQGGLRFQHYTTLAEVLVDGLRLSQGMTRKNALAGLHWGGGKGIMTLPAPYTHPSQFAPGPERQRYFEAYGRFVASLGGIYYTAEDVGTNTPDMAAIQSQNRFTTCIPAHHGGSGNPSPFTARGVLRAMQAAWQAISGSEQLQGVRVAVQGTGNVGAPLIRYLDDLGAQVLVTDVNRAACEALQAERPRLQIIDPPESIFDCDADIFAPCAIGAQVNVDTIPRLKVKLVCGAANNILREPEADAERLRARNIGFVPDFVCNRMGIVNCADEWQGYLPEDVRLAAERVFPDTLRVFKYARSRYATSTQAANDLADMAATELHPLLGHRGRRIIDALLRQGWQRFQPGQPPAAIPSASEPLFVPALAEPDLRVRWEQRGDFLNPAAAQQPYRLAATPVSTASAPDLSRFVSALLLDIKARFLKQGPSPDLAESPGAEAPVARLLGSEHGGLALQLAVEQSLPYAREEIGRSEFLSLCTDTCHRHDALIREQMQQLGIGFDPRHWIAPMTGQARRAVEQAYDFLRRADLLYTLDAIAHHCPRCESIRVASDVLRRRQVLQTCYRLHFRSASGETVPVDVLLPEFLPGAVAVAVDPAGPWAHLAGTELLEPLAQRPLPVIAAEQSEYSLELIYPLAQKRHEKIAQAHGLSARVQIFDPKGQICLPGFEGLSREAARERILAAVPHELLQGRWSVEAPQCSRCEAHLIPRYGEQCFVRIDEAVQQLEQLVRDDQISFSHPFWKDQLLESLRSFRLWCISRQYWWGNALPDQPEAVLSTWFTMAVWSVYGAGWPENPKPRPVDEVFVDAELLSRWVIPSQLLSLILTGQPVFRRIHVHGTLHVLERTLKSRDDAPHTAFDEERFVYHTVRRPMRYRLGNVIEPGTLVRRFGADALRLGYALSLESHAPDLILLSEDRLRLARRTLQRLVAKVSGLFQLVRSPDQSGPARALDHWLLYDSACLREELHPHYLSNRFQTIAESLIAHAEQLVRYINTVVTRRDSADFGAARVTVLRYLERLQAAYGPLCPFVFESLIQQLAPRLSPDELQDLGDCTLCELIEDILDEPESVEPLGPGMLVEVPELKRFFGSDWLLPAEGP